MLSVTALPAFNDNYIWLIHNDLYAVVVDPGDASVVQEALRSMQLELVGILVTHHHPDHIGGLKTLLEEHPARVYGSTTSSVGLISERCSDGQNISIEKIGLELCCIETPGHTLDHICFFSSQDVHEPTLGKTGPALFSGDTLFVSGCGRLFEGTAQQMKNSLATLGKLPQQTLVFCAHEYTMSNLAFARAAMPRSEALDAYIKHAQGLRDSGKPTVPSSLADELQFNPFLNDELPEVIQNASNAGHCAKSDSFAAIRSWKDNF